MKPRPLRASVYAAPGAASRPPRYATPATLAAPSAAAPTRWPSPARLNCQVRSSAAPCSGGAGMARCGTPAHRVSHQVCHWLADTARPCSSHCTRRPPSQAPRQASRQAQPATRHACHAADAVRCSAATRAGVQRSASNTTRPGCKQECGYHLLSSTAVRGPGARTCARAVRCSDGKRYSSSPSGPTSGWPPKRTSAGTT